MTALPIDTAPAVVAGNDRALDVIDALVTRIGANPWGVRELADHLGASRSTVNRVLQGLTARGLAAVDSAGAYTVGPRLRVLTNALFEAHPTLGGARDIIGRARHRLRGHRHGRAAKRPAGNGFHRPRARAARADPLPPHPRHDAAAARRRGRPGDPRRGRHRGPGRRRAAAVQRGNHHRPATAAGGTRQSQSSRVSSPAPASTSRSRPVVAAPFRLDSGIVGAISVTRSRYETTDADLLRFGPLVVAAAKEVAAQHPVTTPPGLQYVPLSLRRAAKTPPVVRR